MRPFELEDFQKLIRDICVAFNRPLNDDLVRVYWDALKPFPFPEIKSRAHSAMVNLKKFPAPSDLKPIEEPPPPPNTYEELPAIHPLARTANFALFKFVAKADPICETQVFPQAVMEALVREKNRIASDFIAMSVEGKVEPQEFLDALDRSFRRITTQRAAA